MRASTSGVEENLHLLSRIRGFFAFQFQIAKQLAWGPFQGPIQEVAQITLVKSVVVYGVTLCVSEYGPLSDRKSE